MTKAKAPEDLQRGKKGTGDGRLLLTMTTEAREAMAFLALTWGCTVSEAARRAAVQQAQQHGWKPVADATTSKSER